MTSRPGLQEASAQWNEVGEMNCHRAPGAVWKREMPFVGSKMQPLNDRKSQAGVYNQLSSASSWMTSLPRPTISVRSGHVRFQASKVFNGLLL
jgi:hypothetical protein